MLVCCTIEAGCSASCGLCVGDVVVACTAAAVASFTKSGNNVLGGIGSVTAGGWGGTIMGCPHA